MNTGEYDIHINQGADFNLSVHMLDADGARVDWTGRTARLQVRKYANATDMLLDLTEGAGLVTTGGLESMVDISLTAAQTEALTWTSGRYDLELVDSLGVVERVLQGAVFVSPEVTR